VASSRVDRPRPRFARMYERISEGMEAKGMGALRDEMLSGVSGDVVEVGAGNGMNFSHYPVTTTKITAIEPEPHLRSLAEHAAARLDVPVTVLAGRAESLPVDDASADVGVVSLMLCALNEQSPALRELFRVIRPGGELRFLEHVASAGPALRSLQRLADATVWPILTGGCRTARDPLTAIVAAGFHVERSRRLRFPDSKLPVPAAPHVLGMAIRPLE
jgi:ubiquinone/menaquinone biosynthesis C-methylase UbiE